MSHNLGASYYDRINRVMSDSIIIWHDYAIFFDIMGTSDEIWEDRRQSDIFRQNMLESGYRKTYLDFCPQRTVIALGSRGSENSESKNLERLARRPI